MLAVEHVVVGDHAAGVGGHAAHGGDHAGDGAAFGFVVGLVVADGVDEVAPFVAVRVVFAAGHFGFPHQAFLGGEVPFVNRRREAAIPAFGDDGAAFAAVQAAGVDFAATGHATAIKQEGGAVLVGVFHGVDIEILVDERLAVRAGLEMAAAEGHGFDGPGVFHPALVVDDVDVEIAEVAAASPEEAVEALDLVHHFADARGFHERVEEAHRAVDAVAALEDDVAQFAVMEAFGQFLHAAVVARHEAHAYFEVFLFGGGGQFQQAPGGRAIHGHGFFHEHVQALFDGVLEMHPAEAGRGGEDGDIARAQAIHRLFVGVKADEAAILGHVHLVAAVFLDLFVAVVQPIGEDVRHGHQFDGALLAGGQSVLRGAGATAAGADEGDPDFIAFGGVTRPGNGGGQGDSRHGFGRGFQEFPARWV